MVTEKAEKIAQRRQKEWKRIANQQEVDFRVESIRDICCAFSARLQFFLIETMDNYSDPLEFELKLTEAGFQVLTKEKRIDSKDSQNSLVGLNEKEIIDHTKFRADMEKKMKESEVSSKKRSFIEILSVFLGFSQHQLPKGEKSESSSEEKEELKTQKPSPKASTGYDRKEIAEFLNYLVSNLKEFEQALPGLEFDRKEKGGYKISVQDYETPEVERVET